MHSSCRCVGFTLIELLVVLAIVSTLLLLVAPRYFRSVDLAKEAVLRDNLRTTRTVIDKFHADTGRYPDTLEELIERKYLLSVPVDPITESKTTWKIIPVPEGHKGQIYDLRSGADKSASDGTKFTDW